MEQKLCLIVEFEEGEVPEDDCLCLARKVRPHSFIRMLQDGLIDGLLDNEVFQQHRQPEDGEKGK